MIDPSPLVLVSGTAIILACGLAAVAVILDVDPRRSLPRPRRSALVERERDIAAGLGITWRWWVAIRVATTLAAVAAGVVAGIWVLALVLAVTTFSGLRFAVAGRAATRSLRMERAFLTQLRHVRDLMAIGNQPLDSALQEIGRNPGRELQYVLAPLAQGGSIVDNLVACGIRARSPIVEQACCVLIWARTRSLDALIGAIDDVLLPVGEAQLAVQEEAVVTLAQQRAVTFAMAGLLLFMFATVLRVDAFRAFYQTSAGAAVLLASTGIFFALVAALGRIVSVPKWTRWDLRRLAEQETRPRV